MTSIADRSLAEPLSDLLVWGVKRGWELLGSPVNIEMTLSGLGYTHPAHLGAALQIHVNPRVLEKPGGDLLLKGLILHELGHHLFHFSDKAYTKINLESRHEKLSSLLNLIMDEHLERRLRAMNAEWGEMLDALASFAFKGQPLRVVLEEYQAFFGFSTREEAVAALEARTSPGSVVSWECGYRIDEEPGWVSYPEFVEWVRDELERHSPGGRLPEDLAARMEGFRIEAAKVELRGRDQGILPVLRADELFARDDFSRVTTSRIHISQLLEKRDDDPDDPARFIEMVRKRVAPFLDHFPKTRRYLDELEAASGSAWFWNKQRAMLFMMRRNRDFKDAFLPAIELSAEEFHDLLGGVFDPAYILERLCRRLNPDAETNTRRPLEVEISWLDSLQRPGSAPYFTFLVILRLGLGRKVAEGRPDVLAALREIPRNLKNQDMPGLWDITRRIGRILGEWVDSESQSPGNESSDPLGELKNSSTDRAHGVLSEPLNDWGDHSESDVIKEAGRKAAEIIDEWLREGMPRAAEEKRRHQPWEKKARPKEVLATRNPQGRGARRPDPTLDRIDADLINLSETLEFPRLELMQPVAENPEQYRRILKPLRPQIRVLRRFLQELGQGDAEVHGARCGARMDPGRLRRLAVARDPGVLIGRELQPAPDLFLGFCVDCSSSMMAEERMDRASSFGALLLEAARGLVGIDCRGLGFTDAAVLDVGGPGKTALGSLYPGGGNNDAGALLELARLALRSRRSHRLLVMISDGFPTECSLESLRALVVELERRYRISCVQVAVAEMEADRVAFPDFTDLSGVETIIAVQQFGRIVRRKILKNLSE